MLNTYSLSGFFNNLLLHLNDMKTQQRRPNLKLDFLSNIRYTKISNPFIKNNFKLTIHTSSIYKDFITYTLLS